MSPWAVRTSVYDPQSNGTIERWHRTIKGDCIRQQTPLTLEDAQRKPVDFSLGADPRGSE